MLEQSDTQRGKTGVEWMRAKGFKVKCRFSHLVYLPAAAIDSFICNLVAPQKFRNLANQVRKTVCAEVLRHFAETLNQGMSSKELAWD